MAEDKQLHADFAKPAGLSPDGEKAYEVIAEHLRSVDPYFTDPSWPASLGQMSGGGCQGFYNPEEWLSAEGKGERYGKGSVLIVVYDGGDLRPYFNLDAAEEGDILLHDFTGKWPEERYGTYERMRKKLEAAGFYAETCTGWYSAIYAKR